MRAKNIVYNSAEIRKYYSASRRRWQDFYPSERWVFERIAREGKLGDVLDIGCACGGLGKALQEKFGIRSYTGVEINKGAVEWAKKNMRIGSPASFICGDFLRARLARRFNMVVSLSCADWNIRTGDMIKRAWGLVKPGGYFVISLRTTPGKGINDIRKSYQRIDFSGNDGGAEIANYVVFNFIESIRMFSGFYPRPQLLGAYGYWGKPSATAVTPFKKLIFAVFYIQKPKQKGQSSGVEFNLPLEAFKER